MDMPTLSPEAREFIEREAQQRSVIPPLARRLVFSTGVVESLSLRAGKSAARFLIIGVSRRRFNHLAKLSFARPHDLNSSQGRS